MSRTTEQKARNAEYMRKWRADNPRKSTTRMRKWRADNLEHCQRNAWKRKYTLTDAQCDKAFAVACCPLCDHVFDGTRAHKRCVDHDHETGENRGVICATCNHMLGNARDNPETLDRGRRYLNGELRNL
jgi:hypothetical protein